MKDTQSSNAAEAGADTKPLTFLSLFAGIGGLDMGLERAGMKCIGQVERDPFCLAVLEKHWPNVPRYTDVSTFDAIGFKPDVVVGGFPCQPHSVAGSRKGRDDKRHLWPHMCRVVRQCRPRWVIGENVPGIRTTSADEVISDLESQGYACWPCVVGADDVGAPHRRKRVFFVAYSGSTRLEGARPRTSGTGEEISESPCCRGDELANTCCARGEARLPGQKEYSSKGITEVIDNNRGGQRWPSRPCEDQHKWEEPRLTEFAMGGTANGVSSRLVRFANKQAIRAFGNAVVPQVAEVIGRAIVEAHRKAEAA